MLLLPIFKIFIFFKKSVTFLRKKWTFWEILNFQSHSSTFLLSLAIFKTWCFFWKNSSNFFSKIKFWTFWKLLLFLSLSKANLLLLPIFKLLLLFKNPSIFRKKMNVLRNRNNRREVAFYGNFAISSDFEEFMFFPVNVICFSIKIDFGTFWEFLLFLSHSTAKLLNSAHFLSLKTIFPKTYLFFAEPQNLNVLRSLTNSVAFYGKFATFSSL